MDDGHIEWMKVYDSAREQDCRDRVLVLVSAGIPYLLRRNDSTISIYVPAGDVERSQAELEAYAMENREAIPRPVRETRDTGGWTGVSAFAFLSISIFILQQRDFGGIEWVELGKTHAGLIRQGQWWRCVTALTLHADLAHLTANLVFGGIVGLFTGRSLGSGMAWCAILIAGASGNLLNAGLRPSDHMSIGASTAVFAALGILTARAWWDRRAQGGTGRERIVPWIGGLVLLSFIGVGGVRTDVAAHVLGFICGSIVGLILGSSVPRLRTNRRVQILFGLMAVTLLMAAWVIAQTTGR